MIRVSYIINTVCLLHVSATVVAILREVHYKGHIYIYIHETGLVVDRFMLYRMYPYHHPADREGKSESGQILCSNVPRT